MSSTELKFHLAGQLDFNPVANTLLNEEGEVTHIGANESRILLLLCENPNRTVSRNEFYEFVWKERGFEVDDSSLTQAISNLRRVLNDSIKSPMFVKTVPKRGYVLVCEIERTPPLPVKPLVEATPVSVEQPSRVNAQPAVEAEVASEVNKVNKLSPAFSQYMTRAMVFVAIILPLYVLLFAKPAKSDFDLVAIYGGTPVKKPSYQPNLTNWYPVLEKCVQEYKQQNSQDKELVEVIITGERTHRLVLHYIHSLEWSDENYTRVIIAKTAQDMAEACQPKL
ncbi:winged helix-turn-helix domain-containing protein [Vibrio maerlii]|uniref:winged helix-turn-helix domain-containing protein n=1 Tax=Vibrio maerlii TaxID=2231648 RepID=UPI000E3BAF28|nr:winged helix-turn-helix domain-containing protein [Vibrio maerlii]